MTIGAVTGNGVAPGRRALHYAASGLVHLLENIYLIPNRQSWLLLAKVAVFGKTAGIGLFEEFAFSETLERDS